MSQDWSELLRLAKKIEEETGASLWEAFRDLKPSEEQLRSWLADLGFTGDNLSDARSQVEGLLAGLGPEEKRQLAGLLRQLLGDKGSAVPDEVWDFVKSLERNR
ncbi:MAG: hypothetical protein QHH27_11040 [Clostridia bacterium]|jgi:hypothetical protein|nr:hypothetical protein [Clostridia bacterium]MDH7574055.1 hypothetical protein [Clostridia bacterium]